jgi:hypothetical protein
VNTSVNNTSVPSTTSSPGDEMNASPGDNTSATDSVVQVKNSLPSEELKNSQPTNDLVQISHSSNQLKNSQSSEDPKNSQPDNQLKNSNGEEEYEEVPTGKTLPPDHYSWRKYYCYH